MVSTSKQLLLENGSKKELFKAAVLLLCSKYQDVERIAIAKQMKKGGAAKEEVNVTQEEVRILAPSWANSILISSMIQHRVCEPITEDSGLSTEQKVRSLSEMLEKYIEKEGLEQPN